MPCVVDSSARSSAALERKGLAIDAMRLRTMDQTLADQHYAEHVERDFYPPLRDFMTGGNPGRPGRFGRRGDRRHPHPDRLDRRPQGRPRQYPRRFLAVEPGNLVHASDSVDSAKRDIALWFPELAE